MIRRGLILLTATARWILPIGILIGLLLPELSAILKPMLPGVVVALLIQSMIRMDWQRVTEALRRPFITLALVTWLLIAIPVMAAFIAPHLVANADLATLLVLSACMPPILSGPALAALLGLDAAAALVGVVASTFFLPFTLPPVAALVSGQMLELAPGILFLRLIAIVGGSMAAATAIRLIVGSGRLSRHAAEVDGIGVIILIIFAIAVMDGVSALLVERSGLVIVFVVAAFVANLAQQGLTAFLFCGAGRRTALTAGFIAGNRNAALLLAVLPPPLDPAVGLFVAAAQFPIYTLPTLLYPIYRRLLSDRLP